MPRRKDSRMQTSIISTQGKETPVSERIIDISVPEVPFSFKETDNCSKLKEFEFKCLPDKNSIVPIAAARPRYLKSTNTPKHLSRHTTALNVTTECNEPSTDQVLSSMPMTPPVAPRSRQEIRQNTRTSCYTSIDNAVFRMNQRRMLSASRMEQV